MNKQEEIKKCDKLMNRYILRARKFIEYACFQYGKYKCMLGKKPDAEFKAIHFTRTTNTII